MKKILLLLTLLSLVLFTGCNTGGEVPGTTDTPDLPSDPPITLTVTYEATEGGEIMGEADQIILYGEDTTPVTAVAEDGWVFIGWDDGCSDTTRFETGVTKNLVITARFLKSNSSEGGFDLPDLPFN